MAWFFKFRPLIQVMETRPFALVRRNVRRPGFTAFPNRNNGLLLGKIDCDVVGNHGWKLCFGMYSSIIWSNAKSIP